MIQQWDEIQTMLRDSARSVCKGLGGAGSSGTDCMPELWRKASELGWLGVALPEDRGGSGGGLVEAGLIASEMGRAGFFGGFAESTAISFALAGLDKRATHEAADLVRQAAEGGIELRLVQPFLHSQAPAEVGIVSTLSAPKAYLIQNDDELRLVGEPVESDSAEEIRITARRRDIQVRARQDRPETVLVEGDAAGMAWEAANRIYRCLAATQLSGAVRALLDIAVEYSRIRQQFGHAIGSYQAVQHAVTDILAGVDAAELLSFRALAALTVSPFEALPIADSAVAFSREAAWSAVIKTYDVLGGVGFIEEHPLSVYTRGMLPVFTSLGSSALCEEMVGESVYRGRWLTYEGGAYSS